jgi:hypothetical protein
VKTEKPGEIKHGREVWIGFDFDGTLAERVPGASFEVLGKPITTVVKKVQALLAEGWYIKIFTARVSSQFSDAEHQRDLIQEWCLKHIGDLLDVTCEKDGSMVELWDDRAVSVMHNGGRWWAFNMVGAW